MSAGLVKLTGPQRKPPQQRSPEAERWGGALRRTQGFTELPETARASSQELGCTLPGRAAASPCPCQQGPLQAGLEPTVVRGQEGRDPMPTQAVSTDQAGRRHSSGADLAPIRTAGTSTLRFVGKFRKEKGEAWPSRWKQCPSNSPTTYSWSHKKAREHSGPHFQMRTVWG